MARAFLVAAAAAMACGMILLSAGVIAPRVSAEVASTPRAETPSPAPPPAEAEATAPPTPPPAPAPTAVPAPARPDPSILASQLAGLEAASGAHVSVTLVDLGPGSTAEHPTAPATVLSFGGSDQLTAASTYKLPLLMDEAQQIAARSISPADQLCFDDSEYEDGWFDDYAAGDCFTRLALAERAGQQSDNTAAHMLVDGIGGGGALDNYATAHGATESAFYDPNTTTSDDLARLLVNEASGAAGGAAAQAWLYPLLTHTAWESGIPAGVPAGTRVVHKIGDLDSAINDAGIVQGTRGAYVLAVMTDGPGGSAGWEIVAEVSAAVWQFENGA